MTWKRRGNGFSQPLKLARRLAARVAEHVLNERIQVRNLRRLVASGLQVPPLAFNTAINACAETGDVESAKEIFVASRQSLVEDTLALGMECRTSSHASPCHEVAGVGAVRLCRTAAAEHRCNCPAASVVVQRLIRLFLH